MYVVRTVPPGARGCSDRGRAPRGSGGAGVGAGAVLGAASPRGDRREGAGAARPRGTSRCRSGGYGRGPAAVGRAALGGIVPALPRSRTHTRACGTGPRRRSGAPGGTRRRRRARSGLPRVPGPVDAAGSARLCGAVGRTAAGECRRPDRRRAGAAERDSGRRASEPRGGPDRRRRDDGCHLFRVGAGPPVVGSAGGGGDRGGRGLTRPIERTAETVDPGECVRRHTGEIALNSGTRRGYVLPSPSHPKSQVGGDISRSDTGWFPARSRSISPVSHQRVGR